MLRHNPALQVHDHPEASLLCNYDPARALCHPDRDTAPATPSLSRCQPHCQNVARVDSHASDLARLASEIQIEIEQGVHPAPIAHRLAQRAAALRVVVADHQQHAHRTRPDGN